MTDPWVIRQGDTGPPYRVRLTDDAGPIPLASAQVRIRMRRHGETAVMIDRPATVPDGDDGWVEHHWAAGDTDLPGLYEAVILVTRPGDVRTYPTSGYLWIRVVPTIPPAPTS